MGNVNLGKKKFRLDPTVRIPVQALLALGILTGMVRPQDYPAPTRPPTALTEHEDRGPQGGTKPQVASRCSTGVSERAFIRNVLCDQKPIWSAPLRSGAHLSLVIPFTVTTAGLIATDKYAGQELTERPPGTGFDVSKKISFMGSPPSVIGFAGAYYGIARLTHNQRMRETALLSFEALADAGIVAGILKVTTQRERPADPNGVPIDGARGKFWVGGGAFPSGHAISTWALASLFASRYSDKPAVKYSAYGLAAAISFSRVTSRQHSPSEVVVGGVFGYLIGRYVARTHHN